MCDDLIVLDGTVLLLFQDARSRSPTHYPELEDRVPPSPQWPDHDIVSHRGEGTIQVKNTNIRGSSGVSPRGVTPLRCLVLAEAPLLVVRVPALTAQLGLPVGPLRHVSHRGLCRAANPFPLKTLCLTKRKRYWASET